ncbi:probable trimeric intracellular cation channel type B [Coccomyxa sp. Obi]|nr:probable trimeric intracellular cation channel type B [Coccomyxa sp. Obi]
MVDSKSALADLGHLIESLPFEYLLIGHCLIVASWFPKLKDRYLLSFWVGALAAFGGGILTALLIQDPKRAPIPLLTSNTVGLTWTISWWLINYFPGNLAARLLSFPPLKISAKVCLNILRAGLIASRIDLTTELYPGVLAAPLIIGSIAGTGGRFSIDPILGGFGALEGPAEIAEPAFAARSGFLGSLLYWLAVHVYGALTPLEGKALITTLFITHGLLVDLFGWHFDFTHPPAYLAHTITNVPMPGRVKQPANSAAPKPAASTADSSKRGGDSRKPENKKLK